MQVAFASRYGPWALITGASSGIGEAFAHALAARGVRPILLARRVGELQRVAEEVGGESGIECDYLVADLSDPSFIDTVLEHCAERDVGLVVSNAGYNPGGSFHQRSRDELLRILDVNDRAPLLLAHAFVPRLVARGRGGLLLTGSIEGFLGHPHSATYSASKGFLQSFGEALWGELKARGVDVFVLAPGPTDTPLLRSRSSGKLPGTLSARAVAEFGLDRLARGPGGVPGQLYRWSTRLLGALPRRTAVRIMGAAMEASNARPAGR